jgi:hypothetical protein
MGAKRRAGAPEGSPQLGQERDAALQHRQEEDGHGSVSRVVEGSTNTKVFETHLTEVLLPTLEEGQVVVMDNLSSHKGQRCSGN